MLQPHWQHYRLTLDSDIDLNLARGIACGNIDPITKDTIVVTPSVNNGPTKPKTWAQPPKPQTAFNKTITSFFSKYLSLLALMPLTGTQNHEYNLEFRYRLSAVTRWH